MRRRSHRAPDPMRSARPPVALVSRRIAGTMGVSEPQVRERRKTSGASLSEFKSDTGPHLIRSAAVRILIPLPLASLADSGHDGSERAAGSQAPKDERSESFGIRTEGRRSASLRSAAATSRARTPVPLLLAVARRQRARWDSNPRPSDVFPRRERDADRSPTLCPD